MFLELTFIPSLMVVLLSAVVGRAISLKINQPMIFGELILGAIIGNFILFTPTAQDHISVLAEIGILMLLFSIGLDLDFDLFKRSAKPASAIAAGGVILPFILGYLAGILFELGRVESLFIGASLVATSVGISAATLQEAGKIRTEVGTLIVDSAVIDDVVGVLIMTILFGFATTGTLPLENTILLILMAALFFLIPLTIGVKAIKKISEELPIQRENILLAGISILLVFAIITEGIGLEAILGAFMAGLMLGQTNFSEPLAESISLVGEGFLVPIFFVTMGMEFKIGAFTSIGPFVIILILLAIIGKIAGSGGVAMLFGHGKNESLATGIAMVPRAEVALIIAHFGFNHNIFGSDLMSAIVVTSIITTMVTPTLLNMVIDKI